MPEKQVLFRINSTLLNKLDKKLAQKGYRTRNAWFHDVVTRYVGEKKKPAVRAPKTARATKATKSRGRRR